MEDHTDAFDDGEHQQYFQGDQDPNRPPPGEESQSQGPPPMPPFKGGNDEASFWLAAVVLGIIAASIWLPPFFRMISSPRYWWSQQEVKKGWFSKWTIFKLIPLVLFIWCAVSIVSYIPEDPNVVDHRSLGLTPEATTNEVKKAWRKLAKTYHPDTMSAPTELDRRRFEGMQAAYTAIMKPDESKEERLREKLWKEQEEAGESVALPAFMLDKNNKKWVMLASVLGVLGPLAYCLYLLHSGALEDVKDPNSGVPSRRGSKNKVKKVQ